VDHAVAVTLERAAERMRFFGIDPALEELPLCCERRQHKLVST
jgi:hypothetical protein